MKAFDILSSLLEDNGWREKTVGPDWSGFLWSENSNRPNYHLEIVNKQGCCILRMVNEGKTIQEIECTIKPLTPAEATIDRLFND
jgi:hypothetical protein